MPPVREVVAFHFIEFYCCSFPPAYPRPPRSVQEMLTATAFQTVFLSTLFFFGRYMTAPEKVRTSDLAPSPHRSESSPVKRRYLSSLNQAILLSFESDEVIS